MSKKSFSFPSVILMGIGDDPNPGEGTGMGQLGGQTGSQNQMIPWSEWQATHPVEGLDAYSCWQEYVSWWLGQGLDEDAFRAVNGGMGFVDAQAVELIPTETFLEL